MATEGTNGLTISMILTKTVRLRSSLSRSICCKTRKMSKQKKAKENRFD